VVAHRELLGRRALLEVLRQARLFVFPSEYEAMSMMLLEAISCRTPVLCSDIPENLEVLVEDYPFVHRSRDAQSLQDVLCDWFADAEAEDWTIQLYERCMSDFSWAGIARDYERLYDEMIVIPIEGADTRTPAGRGEI
jgi:glycosyltransferase involved in cell wall biosynthesis